MLLVVTMILDIHASYLGKIIPNISCPWTMSTKFMVESIDHIHFGPYLIFSYLWPSKCIVCSNVFLASFGSFYFYLVSSCVLFNVGSSDDLICVHFTFKRKILHNVLSMGELSYII